jgi:DnaJ-class molecular chaperone
MDIKVEDLINHCEKCNGTGYFREITGARRGVGMTYRHEGTCPACGGSGGTLTEAGMAVAEVVRYVKRNG